MQPLVGLIDREPEAVHRLQSGGNVVEDDIAALHDFEVGDAVLRDVPLERPVIEPVEVLLNVILEDVIVLASHVLEAIYDIVNVGRGLLEVVHAFVHDVVAQEAQCQGAAGHKGKEAEATPDGSRLSLFRVLRVATSSAEVDEEDNQGGDEPGGWYGCQDTQALQVEIILRIEPKKGN